jgi:hypothetical protein
MKIRTQGLATAAVTGLILTALASVVAAVSLSAGDAAGDVRPADASAETPAHDAPMQPIRFGLDAAGALALHRRGEAPDYGTLWVGPWNLQHGWRDFDRALADLRAADIRPAVHLYYWGDDLTPGCLASGCAGERGTKDVASWHRLADALAERLATTDGPRPMVILETEFNKAAVATHEPLDAALAAMAERIRAAAPRVEIVLGLGNWYPAAWSTWDRAAAASDAIGVQALRAATRHGPGLGVRDDLLAGAAAAASFGKPIVLHDIGVSSYPDAEGAQGRALADLVDAVPDLRAAGVEAILYRAWRDAPGADTGEYFGAAEKHWGLADRDGAVKPAGDVWLQGVAAERARVSTP